MLEVLSDPTNLVALLTLIILEVVLGVDNVVFIAIVTEGLPAEKRPLAQRLGLGVAFIGRVLLVLGVAWLLAAQKPIFTALGHDFSIADLIVIGGGLFLLYKATREIFHTVELREDTHGTEARATMAAAIAEIAVIDVIFAFDSVLTAVGLTKETLLIVIAMAVAIGVMMLYANALGKFIHEHPSLKILALSFLVLIGVMLFAEGFGEHIERGYVYAAILFSLAVEALNFRRQSNLERKRPIAASASAQDRAD